MQECESISYVVYQKTEFLVSQKEIIFQTNYVY